MEFAIKTAGSDKIKNSVVFEILVDDQGAWNSIDDVHLRRDAKILESMQVRPTNIWEYSEFKEEKEILFGPLSTFKIDSTPQWDNSKNYYLIKLKYIDTFVPSNQMFYMKNK